jgi:hypothetical protein
VAERASRQSIQSATSQTLVASLRLLVRRQVHVVRAVLATLARSRAIRRFLLLIDNVSSRTMRIATTCDMISIPRSMRAHDDDADTGETDDVAARYVSLSSSSER